VKQVSPATPGSRFTALGIDVGGTKIAAGLVTFPEGQVHSRRQIRTEPERGGAAVLEDVVRLANDLAAAARLEDAGDDGEAVVGRLKPGQSHCTASEMER